MNQGVEDKFPSIFFELSFSYFEHQMRDSMLQFRKICSPNSKYPIFDYRASIDKFKVINNMEYLLLC
jgi:hypothetical protein